MRRFVLFALCLGALGCGQTQTEAPSTVPDPKPSAAVDVAKAPEVERTLTEAELRPFFTKLGAMAGHGGWSKETIDATINQIKAIKGPALSGNIHLDHDGGHADVEMAVEPQPEGRYLVRFKGANADVIKNIEGQFP